MNQLKDLKNNFSRPLIIIEGEEDIYSVRKVHKNAIQGMLATIAISYGIPIIQTKNSLETASLLKAVAKREQDETTKDFDLCPRYMAVCLDKIKIEPSPKWMQERLVAVGVRPINNVVDVTNYVLLELGQPLHAFDASRICTNFKTNGSECKIIVRRAKKSEILETLDGEKRELDEEMLVIADSNKAIAVAGVMGGVNSEINKETSAVIFESANFNFISIRKTAQKLGLRTEASMRFEKALDPYLCELALIRAIELIKKLCPQARAVSSLVDEKKFKLSQGPIKLDLNWLNRRIGENISEQQVGKILESLGFAVAKNKNLLSITVPTWRATRDVTIPEDLIEEVVRIYGYDKLKFAMPKVEMKHLETDEAWALERKVKNILAGKAALSEVYNYSFVGKDLLVKLGIDNSRHLCLTNPITSHQTMLRQSLAPNLLLNVKTNQARYENFGLFEIGSVFSSVAGEIDKDDNGKEKLPYQERRLAILIAGSKKDNVFSKAKGIVNYLFNPFNLEAVYTYAETKPGWASPKLAANILVKNRNIGLVLRLDSKTGKSLGVKKEVAIAEISLKEFFYLSNEEGDKQFKEYEKFPPAMRDLAFVVDEKILYNDIKEEIENYHEHIKEVELFDIYQGKKLGSGKKNLAFHIIYQSDKTLTSEEIDKLQQGLIKKLEEKLGAKIRDF